MIRICVIVLLSLLTSALQGAEKIAIGASGVDEVVVVDKATGTIESRYAIGKDAECNSLYVDAKGNLLYSYKQGARMVTDRGKVLWDYKVDKPFELQGVAPTPRGYALAICGVPARIVEVDKKGRELSQTTFTVNAKSIHGQFRQIVVLDNDTYLVPIMASGEVINIDKKGVQIGRAVSVEGNLFSVSLAPNGNYIVSAGDAHRAVEVNPHSGVAIREIGSPQGVTFAFVAQTIPRKDGSMLVANWLGHFKEDRSALPHVVEIDSTGSVVWSYINREHQRGASAIFEFNK